jgi:hypothetical protein
MTRRVSILVLASFSALFWSKNFNNGNCFPHFSGVKISITAIAVIEIFTPEK